jgi:hypothetical protein
MMAGMNSIGEAYIFEGSPESIPSDASPGTLWLKSFWESLDSLDATTAPSLAKVVTSNCQFHINGAPPKDLKHLQQSFEQRTALLSEFSHTKCVGVSARAAYGVY